MPRGWLFLRGEQALYPLPAPGEAIVRPQKRGFVKLRT